MQKRISKSMMMIIANIIIIAVLFSSTSFTAFAGTITETANNSKNVVNNEILENNVKTVTAGKISSAEMVSEVPASTNAAGELKPSKIKFTVKITNTVDGSNSPITGQTYINFCYPYKSTTEIGNDNSGINYAYCRLTEDSKNPGTYSYEGTVREKINERNENGKKNCYLYFYYKGYYAQSEYIEYKDENTVMEFHINFSNKAQTENWLRGDVYCFDDCSAYRISHIDSSGADDNKKRSIGNISLYVNGGKVMTYGGGIEYTKSKQLTLWEEFLGQEVNTTKSKQINWIVTKDENPPTSFKQKSDNSVCKVNKGKVSAVAKGTAYVWACRVDPYDKTKVSVDESCCVKVYVYEAPTKLTLKTSNSEDADNISNLDLSIGESKNIYIDFASKGNNPEKGYSIEIISGKEYINVEKNYNNSFKVEALPNVLKNNKPVTAIISVSSLYNSKKAKLKVVVSNGVVETVSITKNGIVKCDAVTSDAITVTASSVKQNVKLSADTINKYITTGAEKYFPDYKEIANAPSTDIPKVFVTTTTNVTKETVYTTKKNKTSIKFSGAKSNNATVSYDKKSGDITFSVKKNAASEVGNIIIVYNTEKFLVIPYTIIASSAPES